MPFVMLKATQELFAWVNVWDKQICTWRICQLCCQGLELEEHNVFNTIFYRIRGTCQWWNMKPTKQYLRIKRGILFIGRETKKTSFFVSGTCFWWFNASTFAPLANNRERTYTTSYKLVKFYSLASGNIVGFNKDPSCICAT